MEDRHTELEKRVLTFKKRYKTAVICWMVIVFAVIIFVGAGGGLLGVILGYLPMVIFHMRLMKKYISSILIDELDPEGYLYALERAKVDPSASLYELTGRFNAGDLQQTVNICESRLKNKKLRKSHGWYYSYLAKVYFFTEDIEMLRETSEKYNAYLAEMKNEAKLRSRFLFMEFVSLYLEERYEEAYELYKKAMADGKLIDNPLGKVQTELTYAVACINTGRTDEAREMLRSIADTAPRTVHGMKARDYMDAIDGKEASEGKRARIVAQEDFETIYKPNPKRQRIRGILLIVAVAIWLTAFGTAFAGRPVSMGKAIERYDGGKVNIITWTEVHGKDCLVVFEREDGSCAVAYLDSKWGDRFICLSVSYDLASGYMYTVWEGNNDIKIDFYVYDEIDHFYTPVANGAPVKYLKIGSGEDRLNICITQIVYKKSVYGKESVRFVGDLDGSVSTYDYE